MKSGSDVILPIAASVLNAIASRPDVNTSDAPHVAWSMAMQLVTLADEHEMKTLSNIENRKIDDVLRLSVRARGCLSEAGYDTIGELKSATAIKLMRLRNFGKTTLREVKRELEYHGLKLADDAAAEVTP